MPLLFLRYLLSYLSLLTFLQIYLFLSIYTSFPNICFALSSSLSSIRGGRMSDAVTEKFLGSLSFQNKVVPRIPLPPDLHWQASCSGRHWFVQQEKLFTCSYLYRLIKDNNEYLINQQKNYVYPMNESIEPGISMWNLPYYFFPLSCPWHFQAEQSLKSVRDKVLNPITELHVISTTALCAFVVLVQLLTFSLLQFPEL